MKSDLQSQIPIHECVCGEIVRKVGMWLSVFIYPVNTAQESAYFCILVLKNKLEVLCWNNRVSNDIWTFRKPSGTNVYREIATVLEAGGPWKRVGRSPLSL